MSCVIFNLSGDRPVLLLFVFSFLTANIFTFLQKSISLDPKTLPSHGIPQKLSLKKILEFEYIDQATV